MIAQTLGLFSSMNNLNLNLKFRLISQMTMPRHLVVKQITIKLNMEERTFAESDVATSSGSKTITYTNPFYAVPAIGISAQNMATGDTYTISSKTVNGFTIAFTNSGGTAVDRTFDYIAKGYGLQRLNIKKV